MTKRATIKVSRTVTQTCVVEIPLAFEPAPYGNALAWRALWDEEDALNAAIDSDDWETEKSTGDEYEFERLW